MGASTEAYILARALVSARVRRMLEIVEERGPDVLTSLRSHPIAELETWADLEVTLLDAVPDSDCAIAGVYFSDYTPARIGIWAESAIPRQHFTALHELGHHLQLHDLDLVAEFDAQPDQGEVLEELTCDAFAAAVLLPEVLVTTHLGAETPSAADVVALWQASGASRAAVCVAAAGRLQSPGHVVLLDENDKVAFASTVGELPLARGRDQSRTAVVRALYATSLPTAAVRDQRFAYRDGIEGGSLYAQATTMGGYTVIVAVAHNAPWETNSLPAAAPALKARWQECTHCQELFQVWNERCPQCGAGFCPECKHCDCPSRVAVLTCHECFLTKPAQVFTTSDTLCDECAGV